MKDPICPLRDLVADFLRQGLVMVPGKPPGPLSSSSMVTIGADGLPFIACQTNAKARQMSAPELLELENQALTQEDMLRAGHPL